MTYNITSAPVAPVTAACTVNEVLVRYPATASIFHELGLDTCCRAHSTLHDAATFARTDLRILLSMLEATAHESFAGTGRTVNGSPVAQAAAARVRESASAARRAPQPHLPARGT